MLMVLNARNQIVSPPRKRMSCAFSVSYTHLDVYKRQVYTFCMCPGGRVICAASEPDGLNINGMSLHARDGENANAAVLVGVRPEDFGSGHPLAGVAFQRGIERAAHHAVGGFRAPCQRVGDFLAGRESAAFGEVQSSYRPGVTPGDVRCCLPEFVVGNLRLARPLDVYKRQPYRSRQTAYPAAW